MFAYLIGITVLLGILLYVANAQVYYGTFEWIFIASETEYWKLSMYMWRWCGTRLSFLAQHLSCDAMATLA